MQSYFIQKFRFFLRNGGVLTALSRAAYAFSRKYLGFELNPLLRRRITVSSQVSRYYGNVIQKGVFRGVQLPSSFCRRAWTNGTMILGQYERPVALSLQLFSDEGFTGLIDIGAANGFYVVASLQVGLFRKAIAYESSRTYRLNMLDWLKECGLESRVSIEGSASTEGLIKLCGDDLSSFVVLVDIDGGEFSLLDETVFDAYRENPFIVELHDWLFPESVEKRRALIESSSRTHACFIMRGNVIDLSGLDLPSMSDVDLFMASVDGRPSIGEWLVLLPITHRFAQLKEKLDVLSLMFNAESD